MGAPWSSQLAADLERDRLRHLVAFVELRAALRQLPDAAFPGGIAERSRALEETEHDSVALVSAGAEAARLQALLEAADRQATDRETDTAEVHSCEYACEMRPERPLSGFKLVKITEPGILASLERIDAMSDEQIRDLASGEPQIIVDAAEGIIDDRHRGRTARPTAS